MADSTTLNFVDQGTVSGTFKYDVTTNQIISWDFVSSEYSGSTFNSATASGQCFGVPCGGSALANQNGDVVFGFDAFQANTNQSLELDFVIACGGAANCVQNTLLAAGNGVGNSFAIASGQPACNPNAQGLCVASGEQVLFNCLGAGCQILLGPTQFLTITDPPSPGDVIVDVTTSNVLVGNNLLNGGGSTGVPEPSSLLLTAMGVAAFALKRACS